MQQHARLHHGMCAACYARHLPPGQQRIALVGIVHNQAPLRPPLLPAGRPPAPTNLQFSTESLESVAVSWDAAPTAARYEVKLLQTAPVSKVASVAIVEDDGGASFSKSFDNLTPGRYSVSIDCELWRGGWNGVGVHTVDRPERWGWGSRGCAAQHVLASDWVGLCVGDAVPAASFRHALSLPPETGRSPQPSTPTATAPPSRLPGATSLWLWARRCRPPSPL